MAFQNRVMQLLKYINHIQIFKNYLNYVVTIMVLKITIKFHTIIIKTYRDPVSY